MRTVMGRDTKNFTVNDQFSPILGDTSWAYFAIPPVYLTDSFATILDRLAHLASINQVDLMEIKLN